MKSLIWKLLADKVFFFKEEIKFDCLSDSKSIT